MSRPTRDRLDIDYQVFNRTGVKVPKARSTVTDMDQGMTDLVSDFKNLAINSRSDVEDFFDTYDVNELEEEGDLVAYISKIGEVKREFRRIHAQIKVKEGDENFQKNHSYFDAELAKLSEYFKIATKKLGDIRSLNKNLLEELESKRIQAQLERERSKIAADWKCGLDQSRWDIDNYQWEQMDDPDEIKNTIFKFEKHLDNFYKARSDLTLHFGAQITSQMQTTNAEHFDSLVSKISSGKERLVIVKKLLHEKCENEKQLAEDIQLEKAKLSEREKINEMLVCAKSLLSELNTRHSILLGKCTIDFDALSDYEILDLKKKEECLHVEMRELMDKASSFDTFVMPCGMDAKVFRDKVALIRSETGEKLTLYLKNLREVVAVRDITEEKIKNSSSFNIDLKKFHGYGSDLDIYSFRSEFKKLVEPRLLKSLWADYIKKNLLSGSALSLVKNFDEIDEIWKKLFDVYGNTHLMLQNKLGALDKFTNFEKLKDDEKIANQIMSLINVMDELSRLATDYSLENDLYYGTGLHKILDLMGRTRQRKFIKSIASLDIGGKPKWSKLKEFLESELKEREAYVLNEKVLKTLGLEKPDDSGKPKNPKKTAPVQEIYASNDSSPSVNPACFICDKRTDHVLSYDSNNICYVAYIACKKFVELGCKARDRLLFRKKFCNKCLKPGMKYNAPHDCDKQYACGQPFTKDGVVKKCEKHVLVCGHHHEDAKNVALLETFKKNVIKPNSKFFNFTKEISISNFANAFTNLESGVEADSIFMFQIVQIANGFRLTFFYDGGCGDAIISKECADLLMQVGRAKLKIPGPLELWGVNNQMSISDHGVYTITLPLRNGKEAKINALCLDEITTVFPKYPLEQVNQDIRSYVENHEKELMPRLPMLSGEVGGKVHLMLGKHYMKYFPREIVRLESGLTMYDSMFESYDHTTGVVCGPHPQFNLVNRSAHFSVGIMRSYYSREALQVIQVSARLGTVPLLGCKESLLDPELVKPFLSDSCTRSELESTNSHPMMSSLKDGNVVCLFGDRLAGEEGNKESRGKIYVSSRGPKCLKVFDKIERAGTEITYRCMDCRNCKECLKGGLIEEISIQEEAEQDLINKNVSVNIEERYSSTKMPFLADPDSRLISNESAARKIFNAQVRKLSKSEKDRNDTLSSEQKLQDLGYVDWLENLSNEDQNMILSSPVRYAIPWLTAFSKSITTPVRTVFNASSKTASGYSLNDILPKGTNNMNNLVEILLRWLIKSHGYHTDVRKMYNSVRMDKHFWRFQLYWWSRTLTPEEEPKLKVIKTCIYGVKCSGNQAERAMQLIADLNKEEYPRAYEIVNHDVYVDDCVSGESSEEERMQATDQLQLSLETGGFTLKGFTFSGSDPDEKLSDDGKSIMVGGVKWFSREDYWMLNVGKINFSRKIRGRKVENISDIPECLTKKLCVSVSAEVFDPTGRVAPILGGIKLDISNLHKIGLGWDDVIPDNLRSIWKTNFEMIEELGSLKYKRVIVPSNAKNLDILTLDAGDASSSLICAAIYARFELRDGTYSCQLVFSRTKIVPEGTTTPRAELMAAALNAATGFTVQKAFGKFHKRHLKLTDSMVAFHWISSSRAVLKTMVRGLVIEIRRLTDLKDWRHVDGSNMPADLGTRKGVKVKEVSEDSVWCKGLPWMVKPEEEFPTSTIEDVLLSQQELADANKEKMVPGYFYVKDFSVYASLPDDQTKLRYGFSKYLIDPNRFRFRKVIRILSLVLTFIKNVSKNFPRILNNKVFTHKGPNDLPNVLSCDSDKYLVTSGSNASSITKSRSGLVVEISDEMLHAAFNYFVLKASAEIIHFLDKKRYTNISKNIGGALYYSGRILPDQQFQGYPDLCNAALDLCQTSFCVPMMDQHSPIAISISLEIHWHHPDVMHGGVESMLREVQCLIYVIGGPWSRT